MNSFCIMFGVLVICFTAMFILMLVFYVLAAAAEYAHHNDDLEYKNHIGEALPYEVGLAYIAWGFLGLIIGYIFDTFNFTPLMQTESVWFAIGIIFLFGLSWVLVHIGCVQLGKKCPQLHNLSWLG